MGVQLGPEARVGYEAKDRGVVVRCTPSLGEKSSESVVTLLPAKMLLSLLRLLRYDYSGAHGSIESSTRVANTS